MQQFKHLHDLFSAHLENYCLNADQLTPRELYEPEVYILKLGGKRIRPLMALIACDLYCSEPARALHSALAVELFHNFTLIHDDILDAAPIRRGMMTVHQKWNTNIAILSGDVMLIKAFLPLENYDDASYIRLSRLMQATAIKVCEGQAGGVLYQSLRQG